MVLSLGLGAISAVGVLHLRKTVLVAKADKESSIESLHSARNDLRFIDLSLKGGQGADEDSNGAHMSSTLNMARFLATARRTSFENGIRLTMVSLGNGVMTENEDIKSTEKPAANVDGITTINVSMHGTFETVDGFKSWLGNIRKLPVAISSLQVNNNVFIASFDVYAKD